MKTRVLGIGLALAAPWWLSPAAAQTPQGDYQRDIFVTTNQQRAAHDLARFKHQKCVQKYAVRQAKRMAEQERIFHQDLVPILVECGLRKAGENVGYGYATGRSVVNRGWMRSEGHRANILDGEFRVLGVGARRSDDGTWYAAQVFGRVLLSRGG